MRLNQAIARSGYCSRRKADEFIKAGKVRVNGEVVTDFRVDIDLEKDRLSVSGRRLSFERLIYVMMNKPAGIVTTMSDERGRRTVSDLLPKELRCLRPVGRLDMYSEGLLLLSNDGELALRLTHPSMHTDKTYELRVRGQVSDQDLRRLAGGLELEDGLTLPAKVKLLSRNNSYTDFRISIREGRNRQLRRMCDYLGYAVVRLRRLGIGKLQLGLIPSGSWRYLTDDEVRLFLPQKPLTD
jgi:23S rRNA pseudouridine2605 synthase